MFIRWRTYQRQNDGVKYDRYIVQPLLVQSYRFKKAVIRKSVPLDFFERAWADSKMKKHITRSRHEILYRFWKFAACDYVYYDNPTHIENRQRYWEYLDYLLTEGALAELDEPTKNKICEEIESLLPRPFGYLLEILEDAYKAGMPEAPSPMAHLRKM